MKAEEPSSNWIYDTDKSGRYRYTLGKKGQKMLLCIGVNPSKAKPGQYDGTVSSVERIANYNGYDGWLMINLYPQRATDPRKIHRRKQRFYHKENLRIIEQYSQYIEDTWCAWGNLIETRAFFNKNLQEIREVIERSPVCWLKADELLKKGHPRHPLYLPSRTILNPFDIKSYLCQ